MTIDVDTYKEDVKEINISKIDYSKVTEDDLFNSKTFKGLSGDQKNKVMGGFYDHSNPAPVDTDSTYKEQRIREKEKSSYLTSVQKNYNDEFKNRGDYQELTNEQQAYGDDMKAFFSEVIDKDTLKKWKDKGEMSSWEVATEFNAEDIIPYVSDVKTLKEMSAYRHHDAIMNGTATPDQVEDFQKMVYSYAEPMMRGYTTWGGVVDASLAAVPDVLEFSAAMMLAAPSGGTSVAATVAKKTATKAGLKAAKYGLKKWFKGIATKKGAGQAIKTAVKQSKFLGKVALYTGHNGVAGYNATELTNDLKITDKGHVIIKEAKYKPATAIYRAMAVHIMSVGTETTIGKAIQPLANGIGSVLSKVTPKAMKTLISGLDKMTGGLASKAIRNNDEVAFNGILGEYGEEFLEASLQHITGLDEQGGYTDFNTLADAVIPDLDGFMQMTGAIVVGGSVSRIPQTAIKGLRRKRKDDKEIFKILESSSMTELEVIAKEQDSFEKNIKTKEGVKTSNVVKTALETSEGVKRTGTASSNLKVVKTPQDALKHVVEGIKKGKYSAAVYDGQMYTPQDIIDLIKNTDVSQKRVGKELLSAIKADGGIAFDKEGELQNIGFKGSRKGKTLEESTTAMVEQGYLEEGSQPADLLELIDSSQKGAKHFSNVHDTAVAENEQNIIKAEQAGYFLRELGINDPSEALKKLKSTTFEKNSVLDKQSKIMNAIATSGLSSERKRSLYKHLRNVGTDYGYRKTVNSIKNEIETLRETEQRDINAKRIVKAMSVKSKELDRDTSVLFKELKDIYNMNKFDAQTKYASNEYQDKENKDPLLDQMLYLKASGRQYVSSEFLDQLADDIVKLRTDGKKAYLNWKKEKIIKVHNLEQALRSKLGSEKRMGVWGTRGGSTKLMNTQLFGKEYAEVLDMIVEENNEAIGIFQKTEKLNNIVMRSYGLKSDRDAAKHMRKISGNKGSITLTDQRTGDKTKFTRMDMVSIFAELHNEDRKAAYLFHYGRENMLKIKDAINKHPEDKSFALELIDFYREYYPEINKAHVQARNRDMGFKKNSTPWVSYNDGSDADDMSKFSIKKKFPGFTKKATIMAKPKPVHPYTNAKRYIADAEHMIHISHKKELIDNTMKKLEAAITYKYGERMWVAVQRKSRIKAIDFKRAELSGQEKLYEAALSNWAKSKIGFKGIIPAKQLISMTYYANEMPAGKFIKELVPAMINYKANKKEIDSITDRLIARKKGGQSSDAIRQIKEAEGILGGKSIIEHLGGNKEKLDDFITALGRGADSAAQYIGGSILFKHYVEVDNMSVDKAIEKVGAVSERLQQTQRKSYRTDFQNTASGISKGFTTFASTPIAIMDKFLEDTINVGRGDISKAEYAKRATTTLLLGSVLLELTNYTQKMILGMDDEEREDYHFFRNVLYNFVSLGLAVIPVFKQGAESLIRGFAGDYVFDSQTAVISDTIKAAKQLSKNDPSYGALVDILSSVATGVSTTNAIDQLSFAEDITK